MLFINVQSVRINVAHIAHYVERRDGVQVHFVGTEPSLMVARATAKEFDDAINRLAQAVQAMKTGYVL